MRTPDPAEPEAEAEAQGEEAVEGEALSTLARAEAAGIVLEPGVPRPPGTPAAAASREGAESYLVRQVHLGVPTEVSPGEKLEVEVSIVPAAPGTVPNSPEGAPEYVGDPVEVLIELVADGAVVPDARLSAIPVELSAEGERLTRVFTVAADAELGAGVDISVHFFVGGYEVGRARAFVVNREADEGEVRPGTPGSVVVPDTILGYQ